MSTEIGKAFIGIEPSAVGFAPKVRGLLAKETGGGGVFSLLGKKAGLSFGVGLGGALAVGGFLEHLGSQFHKAFATIRVDTGATGAKLKSLDGTFKSVLGEVPDSAGKVADAVGLINERLGLTGRPLGALSTQLVDLSRITKTDVGANVSTVTGLFNNWGISAKNMGGTVDELFRASQKSGVSFGDLASQVTGAGVQLRAVGFNFKQSTALIALLGKEGLSVGDVLPALSRGMAKAAKDGVPAAQFFRKTFDQIKNSKSDTAAAGVALDVFGARAGPKLAALVRSGKLSWDQFQQSIARGDSVRKAAAATEDWHEKLGKLKNKLSVDLAPVAGRVFDGIGHAVDFASKHLNVLEPIVLATAASFASFKVIGGTIHLFRGIVTGAKTAVSAVKIVGSAAKSLGSALSQAGPKVAGFFKAGGGKDTIGIRLLQARDAAKSLGSKLMSTGSSLLSFGKNSLKAAANIAVQTGAFVAQKVAMFAAAAAQKAMAAGQWLINTAMDANPIGLVVTAIAALAAGVIFAYKNFKPFRDIVNGVGHACAAAGKGIVRGLGAAFDWVKSHWPLLLAILTGPIGLAVLALKSHWKTIKQDFTKVKDWIGARIGDIIGFFRDLPGRLAGFFKGLWHGLTHGISAAKDWVSDRIGDVVGFVRKLPGRIAHFAVGMWDGITNAFKSAVNAIIDLWNKLHFSAHISVFGHKIGFDLKTPNLPHLARGGVITRPTLAVLGETPAAQPEIAAPLALLQKTFRQEFARGLNATRAPAPIGGAVTHRFAVPSFPTLRVEPIPAITRVAPDWEPSTRGGPVEPLQVSQENHFHGHEKPTAPEIDYAGRQLAWLLANTGRRP